MSTLEQLLKARIGGDSRATTAVIENSGGSIRILFGAIGALSRIVLGVEGDNVLVLVPDRDNEGSRDLALAEAGLRDRDGNLITPTDADISRDLHLSAFGGPAQQTTEPPKLSEGEFVEDNDPLKPGENPDDGVVRLELEGDQTAPRPGDGTGAPLDPAVGSEANTDPAFAEVKQPVSGTDAGGSAAEPAGAAEISPNGGDIGFAGGLGTGGDASPATAAPVEPDSTPAPAPVPPVFVVHKDHNKDQLLEMAGKTPGAEYNAEMTKAQIADAINKATGATNPAE